MYICMYVGTRIVGRPYGVVMPFSVVFLKVFLCVICLDLSPLIGIVARIWAVETAYNEGWWRYISGHKWKISIKYPLNRLTTFCRMDIQ